MPLLGGLLAGLFGKLADFFLTLFTKRVAMGLALATLIAGGFATLYAAVVALLSGIAVVMPEQLSIALAFVFPSNVDSCVSAFVATQAACMGYRVYTLSIPRV